MGHCAFVSASGRRAPGSAIALTLGATVLGSAVSVRELRLLNQTLRSLEEISNRDTLTGVYSRRAGEERLAQDLARAARDGRTTTLVALDLDGLKGLNDSFGLPVGDAFLKRVAVALHSNLREGDWIARWGGDELVLGLRDTADPETATRVLERVARELQETALSPPTPRASPRSPRNPYAQPSALASSSASPATNRRVASPVRTLCCTKPSAGAGLRSSTSLRTSPAGRLRTDARLPVIST